jgi:antitoxin component YwqK of YwqJK toxin-antitoxin module
MYVARASITKQILLMRTSLLFLMLLTCTCLAAQNHKVYYEDKGWCAAPSLKEEGTIKNGKKEGKWKFYYWCPLANAPKKGLMEEGSYSNDKKTGVWKLHSPHVPLELDGVNGWDYTAVLFENGLEQGEQIGYYGTGKIYTRANYKDGKLVGERLEYLQNGTVILSENFTTGEIKKYWNNGKLKERGYYDLGKDWLHSKGEWKEYHENGTLKAVGLYTNDAKSGVWNEYYDNGQLSAKGEMNGYHRVGRWELYHKNGKPSAVGVYNTDGSPKGGTWTNYNISGEKELLNCPEPLASRISALCGSVDGQYEDEDEESRYNYSFEKELEALACVDLKKDSPEEAKKKVQLWWNKYHDNCKCEKINVVLWGGNILKYAISTRFDGFIYSITKTYQLNLNFIDPKDGKTALDFAIEEYEVFKKNNPTHSLVKRMESMIKLLKDGGAKRAREL